MSSLKLVGVCLAVCLLGACSLPRGAALNNTIEQESLSEDAGFVLVEVTKEHLSALETWPDALLKTRAWPRGTSGTGPARIRSGDALFLRIWDNEENSLLTNLGEKTTEIQYLIVDQRGEVFLPYTGSVPVSGLSPMAARQRLQDRLSSISPSVQVQLGIEPGRSNAVDVLGGVGTPGAYPLQSGGHAMLSTLADAGGISTTLRNPQVRLTRGANQFRISASRLYSDPRNNIALHPRDTVVVEEDQRSFTALGAASDQSLIYFPKDEISVIEAIALMEGLNHLRADPKGVLLLRDYPQHQVGGTGPAERHVVFSFDLSRADGLFAARNFDVREDDTVLATESPIRSVQTAFGLVGSLIGIGGQLNGFAN